MKKNIIIFITLCSSNILFAQTTGSLPPLKSTQSINNSNTKKQIQPSKQAQPQQPSSQQDSNKKTYFNASLLVNDAWGFFSGKNGIVDEKKAFDYNQIAIKTLVDEKDKEALSVAKNNLSVLYLCAIDPSVRDTKIGFSYNQDLNDPYSIDNIIWNAFTYLRPINDPKKFYEIIRRDFPNHPVNNYIDKLNGIAPLNQEAAYKFLTEMAEAGDPYAALRVGYRYECYFDKIDINEAIRWYSLSKELHTKNGSNERTLQSVEVRINRLILIRDGKTAK